jgi:hypothetical protein
MKINEEEGPYSMPVGASYNSSSTLSLSTAGANKKFSRRKFSENLVAKGTTANNATAAVDGVFVECDERVHGSSSLSSSSSSSLRESSGNSLHVSFKNFKIIILLLN